MYNKSIFAKLFSLGLTLCIIFTSCSSTNEFNISSAVESKQSDISFRTPSDSMESISKNDFIQLFFDKTTYTVNIKDLQENRTWTTLAEKNVANSYAFALTLYTKNGIYTLNTQDNSVAFGAASYENKDGILTVNYILSDKKETTIKNHEELTENDIYVSFSVTYTMSEQSLYADIDFANMKCTPDSFVADFSVMPCFGASYTDSSEDYFLVPDGSGAVMHLSSSDAPTDSISVNVYGSDPYFGSTNATASSTVPVFGVKRGNSAFAAVITNGDALAQINAHRKTENSPSHIYPSFIITPVSENDSESSVYYGEEYNGKITIAYKFFSGTNANYTSMASAAREEFINNGVMSSSKKDKNTDIPFYLTVVGEADGKQLTTTQQTLDILGILKGKGINNIYLNYKGLLSGGFAQNDLYKSKINTKLGGEDGFNTLYEYTQKQGCSLIIGANLFSSGKAYSSANASYSIFGNKAFFMADNDLGYSENTSNRLVSRIGSEAAALGKEKSNASIYSNIPTYQMNLRKLDSLHDNFSYFLESDLGSTADGFSFSDAGRILYSDLSTNRQNAMQTISSQTRAVSNYGKLTVEGGNIYTVYNAELVSNMEFDTFYTESKNYEPVPFVQAILHGYTFYTGEAIDAGDPLYRYDMLRFIEYGALPGYEWIYANDNIFCYSGYVLSERISEIVDFYNDAAEIFTPLTDETITSHRKIEKDSDGNAVSGVYCTTYSDGTEVYVNYTGSIVSTPENIAVGPYDFVAVKR